MYHFIWTPILKFFLVCSSDRKWWSLVRQIGLSWSLWFDFEISISSHMLCLPIHIMWVDYFMLFLNIKRFKIMSCSDSLYGVETSMLSLVVCMDAFWIMISNMLIYHLSSSRSSHEVLVILNKIDRGFFRACIKGISNRLLCIVVIILVLYDPLICSRALTSRWFPSYCLHSVRVFCHYHFFCFISF
jgi:hypothetical protein